MGNSVFFAIEALILKRIIRGLGKSAPVKRPEAPLPLDSANARKARFNGHVLDLGMQTSTYSRLSEFFTTFP